MSFPVENQEIWVKVEQVGKTGLLWRKKHLIVPWAQAAVVRG